MSEVNYLRIGHTAEGQDIVIPLETDLDLAGATGRVLWRKGDLEGVIEAEFEEEEPALKFTFNRSLPPGVYSLWPEYSKGSQRIPGGEAVVLEVVEMPAV